MTVVLSIRADQRGDLRVDLYGFDLPPASHQRVEHIGPAARPDDQGALALGKVIGEKRGLAAQEKQPPVIPREAEHVRASPAIDVQIQARVARAIYEVGARISTPARGLYFPAMARRAQRPEHRLVSGLGQRSEVDELALLGAVGDDPNRQNNGANPCPAAQKERGGRHRKDARAQQGTDAAQPFEGRHDVEDAEGRADQVPKVEDLALLVPRPEGEGEERASRDEGEAGAGDHQR